jgi:hypothetical protein
MNRYNENDLLHSVEMIDTNEVPDKTCLVVHHSDETTIQDLHALRVAIIVSNVVRKDTWQEIVQMQTFVDKMAIKEYEEISIEMKKAEDTAETTEAAFVEEMG